MYGWREDGICDPSALSSTQERICEGNRDVVYTIAQGVEVGLAQCQDRFVARRWNCSVQPAHFSYFLTATQQGETAHTSAQVTQYIYALSHTHTCSITRFYPHFYLALHPPSYPSSLHHSHTCNLTPTPSYPSSLPHSPQTPPKQLTSRQSLVPE